ncbi:unnamed protein product [Caenorhabditis brenneri]
MSIPITYPSLKSILQYVECNKRVQLSLRIPCIRKAEKATPLLIESLYIEPLHMSINKTKYSLGVVRTSENEDLLKPYESQNSKGGEQSDLDKYGIPEKSFEMTAFPGDVVLEKTPPHEPRNLEELELVLRRILIQEGLERAELAPEDQAPQNQAMEAPGENDVDQFEDVIAPQADVLDELYETEVRFHKLQISTINDYQHMILPLRLRADNAASPFKNFVQLTVKANDKNIAVERLVYNQTVYKYMKHLMVSIFGGRRKFGKVYVKKFYSPLNGGVLRVPEGLQLRIKHVDTGRNVKSVMDGLKTIIDESSFPLKSIELSSTFPLLEDIQHEVVKKANKLILRESRGFNSWLDIFLELQNREVFWRRGALTIEETVTFVKSWLENGKPIGTTFKFAIAREEFAKEILPLLKELPNAKFIETGYGPSLFPDCITFPIGDDAELKIYGVKCETVYREALWDFVMKIVPRTAS